MPSLIQRDLTPEHDRHDPATTTFTGVIDWADTSIGNPAHDFTDISRAFGRPFAERVLAAYTPASDDRTFWERVRFYGASVQCYAIRCGQLSSDEEPIAQGLRNLRTL